MRGHKDRVTCANDEIIVSGSYDKSIIRWVAANGEQIGEPLFNDDLVDCFSISGDGKFIISSAWFHYLFRWDTISGELKGKSVSNYVSAPHIWANYRMMVPK